MKIAEAIRRAVLDLQSARVEFSEMEVRWILGYVLGLDSTGLYLQAEKPLSENEQKHFFDLIGKRCLDYPTAYLLGETDFYKNTFCIEEGVLIPRPETEGLIDLALGELHKIENPRFADFGCGSGCIGLSLLLALKRGKALLVDDSEAAIQIAKKNIKKHFLDESITVKKTKVEKLVPYCRELGWTGLDMIISNPPYISTQSKEVSGSVMKYEPHEALFGGGKGWELYEPWSEVAYQLLKPGGFFLCEIGFDQGSVLLNLFASSSLWRESKVLKDLAGRDRYLIIKKSH